MVSGGLGKVQPCSSANRSRLLPEVSDDCAHVGLKLSPRYGAIIKEMNENVCALNFFETNGIGLP